MLSVARAQSSSSFAVDVEERKTLLEPLAANGDDVDGAAGEKRYNYEGEEGRKTLEAGESRGEGEEEGCCFFLSP